MSNILFRACAVDALIVNKNKDQVLMIARNHKPYQGCYVLPGGFVDPDETVFNAVVREAREETGLRVTPLEVVGIYSNPERDPRQNISIVYFCTVAGSEDPTSDSEGRCTWFKLDVIEKLYRAGNIGFDHFDMIRDASDQDLLPPFTHGDSFRQAADD